VKSTTLKNRYLTRFTILLTFLFLLPITESSAAGRSAKSVANTILNGKGAPKISIGIDGDFYIDTRSLLMYGPKKKGRWPVPTNLQGPTGPTGATGNPGKSGSDGKAISSASTTSGPQGPIGPAGPQGLIGLPGAPGPIGPAGKDGTPGLSGPAGSSGGSGPAGATGLTGATGLQGPAGPSEVTVVDIPEWILSSAMPFSYSNSLAIGNLVAGNSYQVKIHLSGVSVFNNLVLGIDLIAPDSTFKFTYSRDDFRFATYTTSQSIYTFDIHATVKVGGSNSHLIVRVIDAFGDTGSSRLTLKGTAYITLVGAIR
jgi:hypothetical protein